MLTHSVRLLLMGTMLPVITLGHRDNYPHGVLPDQSQTIQAFPEAPKHGPTNASAPNPKHIGLAIQKTNDLDQIAIDKLSSPFERQKPNLRPSTADLLKKKQRMTFLKRLIAAKNLSCAFVYLQTIDENGTAHYDPEIQLQDVNIQVVNEYDVSRAGNGRSSSGRAAGPGVPNTQSDNYDPTGAMYFAVAVITIYGLSIALLIASGMRRSDEDYELKGFIRSFAQLDGTKNKKPKDKFKIQKALLESGILIKLTAQGLPRKVLPDFIQCTPVTAEHAQIPVVAATAVGSAPSTPHQHSAVNSAGVATATAEHRGPADCKPDLCSINEHGHESLQGSSLDSCPNPQGGVGQKTDAFTSSGASYMDSEDQNIAVSQYTPSGPRRVKIYQSSDNSKVDIRSVDIAVDIPEDSII